MFSARVSASSVSLLHGFYSLLGHQVFRAAVGRFLFAFYTSTLTHAADRGSSPSSNHFRLGIIYSEHVNLICLAPNHRVVRERILTEGYGLGPCSLSNQILAFLLPSFHAIMQTSISLMSPIGICTPVDVPCNSDESLSFQQDMLQQCLALSSLFNHANHYTF